MAHNPCSCFVQKVLIKKICSLKCKILMFLRYINKIVLKKYEKNCNYDASVGCMDDCHTLLCLLFERW
jgi:hypothetical protein